MRFIPKSIRHFARRYIERRGFIPVSAGPPSLHTALRRRRDISVATVIDVGASDGRWSGEVMHFFPDARYLLIEAQEKAHGAGLQKFKAMHPNVEYELCAAGNREGEIFFGASDPLGGQASEIPYARNNIRVRMRMVDDLVRQYNMPGPYLLKLDMHGFEVAILEGARETMAQAGMLIVEAYNFTLCPGALRFHELCAYLEERGFRCGDVFDLIVRPQDEAFWQMDMVFLPRRHVIFRSNAYRSEQS